MEKRATVKKTTVYLPIELDAQIRQSATQERRSYNSQIIWLLEQALKRREHDKA